MDLALELLLPAVAGSCAVVFTHPAELAKTRLQLDRELASFGAPRQYKGWLDCVGKTYAQDGLPGLQRGLALGVTREFFFNATRIGLSGPMVAAIAASEAPTRTDRLAAGLACGALGGCVVNPLEVLKIRAQSSGGRTGFQHDRRAVGVFAQLLALARTEGARGLCKGIGTSIFRGMVGPGSQLVAYNELKTAAVARGRDGAAVSTHVACSLMSAAVSIVLVNPPDVVRTRLYNQPVDSLGRGLHYNNGLHALSRIVSAEGPAALYKGALTHYLRLGPHMVLVFGFLEQFKLLAKAAR
ncbi:mitochondrial carrier domain-containing protein [Pelagophyceae sp. CCMP2097]|nr:mitochondrial carrier domain-containing protein [Pelagophyceae sp. CCMP2097]|mmetsp:Transcript_12101/g.40371  ORF Transcript_12101/g.40371 Transcript_12101/m.40371 type:complete len:298 (+) Transcript_12101:83-976(+)